MYNKKLFIFFIFIVNICYLHCSNAEVPIATDSRIKTYVYNENDVYLLLINTGFQSSIEFEKGEKVQTLSLGDSYSWSITPVDNRLVIKPLENNVRTNMMVITNIRNYQFDIVSKSDDNNQDISYVVKFYYPKVRRR
jgi:type IV secretion system protein VirB9